MVKDIFNNDYPPIFVNEFTNRVQQELEKNKKAGNTTATVTVPRTKTLDINMVEQMQQMFKDLPPHVTQYGCNHATYEQLKKDLIPLPFPSAATGVGAMKMYGVPIHTKEHLADGWMELVSSDGTVKHHKMWDVESKQSREYRIGEYAIAFAKKLGWDDTGEGIFEFIQRKSYAQGYEDGELSNKENNHE